MHLSEDQQMYKDMKPHLRFMPGDIVYFKTDRLNKNPMVIEKFVNVFSDENGDYWCSWFDSQKCHKGGEFFDYTLKTE
jgi:hypothetical protein